MSKTVDILAPEQYEINEARLEQAAVHVLQRHHASADCKLTVVFTDNDCLRDLNHKHRQSDTVTDVLSFPAAPVPQELSGNQTYLGDIIISYPYTRANCVSRDVDLQDALCLLVVHGALHLLGFDHDCETSYKQMWTQQELALRSLQIEPAIVSEYGGFDRG